MGSDAEMPDVGDVDESWADVRDAGFVQDIAIPASSGSDARSQCSKSTMVSATKEEPPQAPVDDQKVPASRKNQEAFRALLLNSSTWSRRIDASVSKTWSKTTYAI